MAEDVQSGDSGDENGAVQGKHWFASTHWSVVLAMVSVVFGAAAAPATDHGDIGAGEGPVWHLQGHLLFTGGGRITRRDQHGNVSVFRQEAGGANGLLYDHQGRLVVCEAGRRRITRTELDGSTTVLAGNYRSNRFNSPNDLTIDSRGRIYFTDPRYGPRDTMEIKDDTGRWVEGVYRIDGPGRVTQIIASEVERPNGILVGPRDKHLYVADNNNNNVGGARKLWRFNLRSDGSVEPRSRKLIFDWQDARGPDGLKMDRRGRLFVAAGLNRPNPPFETADRWRGGIYLISPRGRLLQFIPIPNDEVTNCALGGEDLNTLFITAGGHLWSVRVDPPRSNLKTPRNGRGAHLGLVPKARELALVGKTDGSGVGGRGVSAPPNKQFLVKLMTGDWRLGTGDWSRLYLSERTP